jgi:hypothetical protein
MRKLSLVASLAVALLGCGSSTTTTAVTTTTTTLPPCTQAILFQGGGAHPAKTLVRVPFAIATAGRLDIIFDWTLTTNPFGLYVVSAGSCPLDLFNASGCNFLLRSESAAKPRRVSLANITTGSYEMLVANFGSQDDSVTTQIILSSSSCPPLASAPLASERWAAPGPLTETARY